MTSPEMLRRMEERALELANKMNAAKDQCTQSVCLEHGVKDITAAMKDLWNEALESSAGIAETETKWFKEKNDGSISLATSTLIANSIRERKL